MALKPYMQVNPADTFIDYFMNVTAEKGQFVIHDSAGSGEALDDANNVVALPTGQAVSGTDPAGILLCDVVDKDLTQTHLNAHKDEVQVGSKVVIARRGVFLTDQLVSGDTPTVGDKAYYNNAGLFTTTSSGSAIQVGRFMGAKDSDGYVKVEINVI